MSLGRTVAMRSMTPVGHLRDARIRSDPCECTWEEKRLLCRSEAVCSVLLEKGLVSWLQEGKGTCSGSAPRGGGGGTGVND